MKRRTTPKRHRVKAEQPKRSELSSPFISPSLSAAGADPAKVAKPAEKKRWRVHGTVTVSITTEVEAATSEEAELAALDHPIMTLCNQCDGGGNRSCEWSVELDGEINEELEATPL